MKTATNLHPELIKSFESEGYSNYLLSPYDVQRRLDAHGVPLMFPKGRDVWPEAMDDDGLYTIDTTNWTLFDMLAFLNY